LITGIITGAVTFNVALQNFVGEK